MIPIFLQQVPAPAECHEHCEDMNTHSQITSLLRFEQMSERISYHSVIGEHLPFSRQLKGNSQLLISISLPFRKNCSSPQSPGKQGAPLIEQSCSSQLSAGTVSLAQTSPQTKLPLPIQIRVLLHRHILELHQNWFGIQALNCHPKVKVFSIEKAS